jgi:hypothetical protein
MLMVSLRIITQNRPIINSFIAYARAGMAIPASWPAPSLSLTPQQPVQKLTRQSGSQGLFPEPPRSFRSSNASSPSQESIAFSFQNGRREHSRFYNQPRAFGSNQAQSFREPNRHRVPAVARVVSRHYLPAHHNRTPLGMYFFSSIWARYAAHLPFQKFHCSFHFSAFCYTFPLPNITLFPPTLAYSIVPTHFPSFHHHQLLFQISTSFHKRSFSFLHCPVFTSTSIHCRSFLFPNRLVFFLPSELLF